MKIRHILLVLAAVLAIAFLQPLITFLGGLTLLLGVGTLIFRDLTPVGQDAVERRVLSWLRRARSEAAATPRPSAPASHRLPATSTEPGLPGEQPRRGRTRSAAVDATGDGSAPPIP